MASFTPEEKEKLSSTNKKISELARKYRTTRDPKDKEALERLKEERQKASKEASLRRQSSKRSLQLAKMPKKSGPDS